MGVEAQAWPLIIVVIAAVIAGFMTVVCMLIERARNTNNVVVYVPTHGYESYPYTSTEGR